MRNSGLMLVMCIGSFLLGCSSKPDVSDIAPELEKFWGTCTLVQLDNLKKTNGLYNGNTYRMAYSYTLDVLEDFNDAGEHCTVQNFNALQDLAFRAIFKKGDVITVTNELNMVKTENGWISQ